MRIEPAASREQYKWMERFVVGVTDEPLRERLVIAIDGKGAFRRFKDVLLNYPTERERWFSLSRRSAPLADAEVAGKGAAHAEGSGAVGRAEAAARG